MHRLVWPLTLGLLVATISLVQIARGDTVYMADGRVLHGKVTETPDGIQLVTRIGTITFPANTVSSWQKDNTDSAAPTPITPQTEPSIVTPATQPAPASPAPTKAARKSGKSKMAKSNAATQPGVAAATPAGGAKISAAAQPDMTASARGIAPSPTMTLTPAVVLGSAATQPTTDRSIPESKRKYEADIRDLLAARWNDLDSLIVTADEQVSGDQTQNLHVVFRFFGDRAYWEANDSASPGDKQVVALLPDKVILVDKKGVTLQKPTSENFRLSDGLDVALGYRAPADAQWLTPDVLAKWKMKFPGADAASLNLSITPEGGTKLNRVMTYARPQQYACSGVEVTRKNMMIEEITCDGFQPVGTWNLPNHIVLQRFGEDGQPTRKIDIQIKSFDLNDPKNTPDTYSDFWPAGTPVTDQTAQSSSQ